MYLDREKQHVNIMTLVIKKTIEGVQLDDSSSSLFYNTDNFYNIEI